jgi:sirohydrochlorin ferrochelatase
VRATLLIAAHGTRSATGSATTAALAGAIAAARPDTPVRLCFLDVAEPSLAQALDELAGQAVVVVPLLLSGGYHVHTDIPAVVAGRQEVRVARHLGPDPAVLAAVANRLDEAGGTRGPVLLAAIASSQATARAEVDAAAAGLAAVLARPVAVLPLGPGSAAELDATATPYSVASYLLAEGGFFDNLRAAVRGRGVVAEPLGVHPALVALVWNRYDEAVNRGAG